MNSEDGDDDAEGGTSSNPLQLSLFLKQIKTLATKVFGGNGKNSATCYEADSEWYTASPLILQPASVEIILSHKPNIIHRDL